MNIWRWVGCKTLEKKSKKKKEPNVGRKFSKSEISVDTARISGSGRLTQKVTIGIHEVSGNNVRLTVNGQPSEWICKSWGDILELNVNFDFSRIT